MSGRRQHGAWTGWILLRRAASCVIAVLAVLWLGTSAAWATAGWVVPPDNVINGVTLTAGGVTNWKDTGTATLALGCQNNAPSGWNYAVVWNVINLSTSAVSVGSTSTGTCGNSSNVNRSFTPASGYGIDNIVVCDQAVSANCSTGTKAQWYPVGHPSRPAEAVDCTTQLVDAAVTYGSSKFQVRFRPVGTVTSVNFIDNATSSTSPSQTASSGGTLTGSSVAWSLTATDSLSDGSGGYWYRADLADSTESTHQAMLVVKNGSAIVCKKLVTVGAGTLNPNGSTTGAVDADTGTDCGWNPFCYIKAALKWGFVPPDGTMDSWSTKLANINSHPPVSIISTAIAFFSDIGVQGLCNLDSSRCQPGVTNAHGGLAVPALESPDGGASVDLLDSAGDLMQDNTMGHLIYQLVSAAIAGVFLIRCWQLVAARFGHGGEV